MTHDTHTSNLSFGTRLKLARETIGLETKEVASQLCLNEKYIHMMEKEHYPSDLPQTFIRGYLRAYGRLLQIPADEISKALQQLNATQQTKPQTTRSYTPIVHDYYFIRFSTYFILLTMIGLTSMWWVTRSNSNAPLITVTEAKRPAPPTPQTVLAQTEPTRNNIRHNTTQSASHPSSTSDDSDEKDDTDIE